MGVNEAPAGHRTLELHAQPADVDVHRAISCTELSSPGEPAEMLAGDDSICVPRELRQQAQLSGREQEGSAAHAREMLGREDLERTYRYHVGVGLRRPQR